MKMFLMWLDKLDTAQTITAILATYGAILSTYNAVIARLDKKSERRAKQVRIWHDGSLYVERSALKKDDAGYYIPGYGRFGDSVESVDKHHPPGEKVAFLCRDMRAAAELTPRYYVIGTVQL